MNKVVVPASLGTGLRGTVPLQLMLISLSQSTIHGNPVIGAVHPPRNPHINPFTILIYPQYTR